MKIFYSASQKGFFDQAGGALPSDAVEITVAQYTSLLAAQSVGKVITAGSDGKPLAVDPPAPSQDEVRATAKAKLRDIDASTVRGLREWMAAQPNAPQIVKDHEIAAQAERAKLA